MSDEHEYPLGNISTAKEFHTLCFNRGFINSSFEEWLFERVKEREQEKNELQHENKVLTKMLIK